MSLLRRGSHGTALTVALVLSMTGCGMYENPYQKSGPEETAGAAEKLVSLPSLEDTETQVRQAVEELGAHVSSLVPGLTWRWIRSRSSADCDPPYDQTQGQQVRLQFYSASRGIPDEVWPQVRDRARELAARVGATESEKFANEPGHHNVRFFSREGTAFQVGSQGAVITSNTGCRLPAAMKSPPDGPPSSAGPTPPQP